MDIAKIRKLIKLVQASDITEIEVIEGEQKVRISRSVAAPEPAVVPALPTAMPQAVDPALEVALVAGGAAVNDACVLSSPMVGTFYRASSPDIDPFVREGSRVQKGDTLCIIEAMKLMNAIEAEYDGVVRLILVENASPVEYGQPMFEITPA
ncbi:MAG: acetyl-CoA carboxylase biotin carboxyl carrier protein [Mariprofundaceae bacterium]|nr:acetyl-CoA carboxylase biotin carboxyl carrier protein [Mariprofundaceae bacterium]